MRVVVVAPWLAPEGGGLERYASHVAEELDARGHDTTLVGHTSRAAPIDERATPVRRIGIAPHFRLSNTPLSLAFARRLRALIRAERPDVVNAHTPVPGAAEMAAWAARKERVPFVVTYHAGRLLSGARSLAPVAALHRATFERAMLARANARIAVSRYVAERAFAGLDSTIVPPGVDLAHFAPGGQSVPGRVLFVGPTSRAYRWKGLDVLARALRRVPGAHLRVVGDGDLAESYRQAGVDVVGRVDDARLADEYRAASVVALPSTTDAESFGMVLAEANACGRPVVGSRIGGIPCFVRDGENGLLVPPADEGALASALRRLLGDEQAGRKMGERGRALVEREHAWERVGERTLDVYAQAIATHQAGARSSKRSLQRRLAARQ